MEFEDQLLESLSLKDLIDLSKIKSVGMVNGKRDVILTDPLEYTTYSAEDVPLPEGTEVIVEGSPINRKEILVQTDQPTGFGKFLAGLRDVVSGNKYDYDRQDRIPLEEFQQKEIVKQKRKADLSGRPTLTKQEAIDSLPGRRVLDQYEAQKMQEQRNEQLKYLLAAYPQLAGMINDEIANRRYEAETRMPSEIQKRLNSSRNNYVSALLARSQAQKNIADSVATGLGRYSGIRNVAG